RRRRPRDAGGRDAPPLRPPDRHSRRRRADPRRRPDRARRERRGAGHGPRRWRGDRRERERPAACGRDRRAVPEPPPARRRRPRPDPALPRRRTRGMTYRLRYRSPLDWTALLDFLAPRAIPGVEVVDGDVYRRTCAGGVIDVAPGRGAALTLRGPSESDPAPLVARARRLFDLDADPVAIGDHLRRSPRLAPLIALRPGLRVPGAWDPFETAVRAILGQQVSVRAATTLAGRLVQAFGEPVRTSDPGLTHR